MLCFKSDVRKSYAVFSFEADEKVFVFTETFVESPICRPL